MQRNNVAKNWYSLYEITYKTNLNNTHREWPQKGGGGLSVAGGMDDTARRRVEGG